MSRTAIGVLMQRGEIQHNWKWVYADASLPFGLPYEYVEGCSLSFNNLSANQIHVNAGFLMMPGTHTVAPISVTFAESGTGIVTKWIESWKAKVKDFKSGLYGGQSDYKRDMKFSLLDTRGNAHTTLRYMGCFPLETGNLDLEYSESGRVSISQPFSVDDMEVV